MAAACESATADAFDDRARVARAIGYLDARQEAWASFTRAGRGEGADRTSCVSCHTGLSYLLTRPALGRFTAEPGAVPAPAAAEARIRAAAALRVEHWSALDTPRFALMYDFDDRKKVESRGTEAVLNALILARADALDGRAETSPATATALRQLWATQTTAGPEAGSWEWLNFGLEPWEAPRARTFGAALAALAVGSAPGSAASPPDDTAARGAGLLRDYLRRRFPDECLHNRLWILDTSATFEGVLSTAQARETVDQLLALQQDDGGWALATLGGYKRIDGSDQARDSDGYATGLAVHVLRAHAQSNTRAALDRGLAWLRSHQQADGSWPGHSVNKKRDPATMAGKIMTDAATAFAARALLEVGTVPSGAGAATGSKLEVPDGAPAR
jgi:squalene-hopene/tetraprenyl-beta-curcumene cyclase